jgi:hypothetical protein
MKDIPGLRENKGRIFLNHPPDLERRDMKAEKIYTKWQTLKH